MIILPLPKRRFSKTSTANGFLGLLDEIRVSYGILQPEEFLRQKSFDGLLLLVK